jgi:hypothetical protein
MTPRFNAGYGGRTPLIQNRFNGFPGAHSKRKPLKRFGRQKRWAPCPALKRGVINKRQRVSLAERLRQEYQDAPIPNLNV